MNPMGDTPWHPPNQIGWKHVQICGSVDERHMPDSADTAQVGTLSNEKMIIVSFLCRAHNSVYIFSSAG